MGIHIDAPQGLARDQRMVFDELRNVVMHAYTADAAYRKLAASKAGTLISVDVARLLAPEFHSWTGRLRHTPSTATPAGAYAHDYLLRTLVDKSISKQDRTLFVTAGGAGSGKTTLLSAHPHRAHFIFDNQLRNFERAKQIFETALANDWSVQVAFVHRPFVDVVSAVAERSQRTGRWNSMQELAESHVAAQANVVRLRRLFADRIKFRAYFNASSQYKSHEKPGRRVLFVELARGGRYHLPSAEQIRSKIPGIVLAAVRQGRICKEVAQLILRSKQTT